MRTYGLSVVCVLLALSGCGGSEPSPEADEQEAPATTEEESRCDPAPKPLLAAIAEGLTVQGGGSLRNGHAVKSEDLKSVYYVSADIQGAGLQGNADIGTWATNSLTPGDGLILAADAVAKEFSDWGAAAQPGSDAAEVMSMENDGAEESKACAEG